MTVFLQAEKRLPKVAWSTRVWVTASSGDRAINLKCLPLCFISSMTVKCIWFSSGLSSTFWMASGKVIGDVVWPCAEFLRRFKRHLNLKTRVFMVWGSRQKPRQTAMQMTSPTVIPVENLLQRDSTALVLLLVWQQHRLLPKRRVLMIPMMSAWVRPRTWVTESRQRQRSSTHSCWEEARPLAFRNCRLCQAWLYLQESKSLDENSESVAWRLFVWHLPDGTSEKEKVCPRSTYRLLAEISRWTSAHIFLAILYVES